MFQKDFIRSLKNITLITKNSYMTTQIPTIQILKKRLKDYTLKININKIKKYICRFY